MKTAIVAVLLELADGSPQAAVRIRYPAIPRGLQFSLRPRLLVSGAGEKQAYDEVLVLMAECSPDGDLLERRFVVLGTGDLYEPPQGWEIRFVASAVSPHSGRAQHLFELVARDVA